MKILAGVQIPYNSFYVEFAARASITKFAKIFAKIFAKKISFLQKNRASPPAAPPLYPPRTGGVMVSHAGGVSTRYTPCTPG